MNRFSTASCLCLLSVMQLTETAQSVVWADPNGYLANVVQQLQIAWPHNRTINLVFHGGDVPAGYAATPVVDTFNAYPHLLHTALKEKYPNAVINIIITAGGGEASDGGAKRFARDVLNHNPDVIFLDYGLNDRRIGLQEAEKAWSLMIKQAKAQNVPVVLLTPTADVHADIQNPNDLLCKHALQIRKLAVLNEVALIDSLRRFTEYVRQGGNLEDLMSQSGHPNRKGHELVAAELAKWFSPNPPSKSEN